jgi:hypothetical protein
MVFAYFRQMIYVALLLTNAVAILNEERFLAKSECRREPFPPVHSTGLM